MCIPCFVDQFDGVHYLELWHAAGPSIENVRSKLFSLAPTYAKSERFFPVEYLTLLLEQHSCERRWPVDSVQLLLREMGVPIALLFNMYDKMFKAKVRDCL